MKFIFMFAFVLIALTVIGCQESVSIPETGSTEAFSLHEYQRDKDIQNLNMQLILDDNESIRISSVNDMAIILSNMKADQLNELVSNGSVALECNDISVSILTVMLSANYDLSFNATSELIILAGDASWGCIKSCIKSHPGGGLPLENCLAGCDPKVDPVQE